MGLLFGFDIVAVCALVIVSALVYGMFGFGYALIAIAVLPMFLSVKVVIPMIVIQSPIFTGTMLYGLRRHLDIRAALPLVGGLIMGLPIGVYLLRILSEESLRKFLGIVIILHAIFSFNQKFRKLKNYLFKS